jgi:glycosyltransferase involved in cell wall biosynthesis
MPVDRSCDLSVGVVVPVFNEGESLDYYLSRLYEVTRARCPVVLVDGGSTDSSVSIGQRYFHTESTGRPNQGEQLKRGARCLLTDVVLFLHADAELPQGFDLHIRRALSDGREREDVFGYSSMTRTQS